MRMIDFVPLLAFGFLSPWMLGGMALGGIPIVIHLLYRQRYRETTWAAMRFLAAAIRKQSQRMRIEQWLLLAVRTAILLLVALALAGPTTDTLTAFVPAGNRPPAQRIVVIDSTLSMSAAGQNRSRFEQAQEVARKLLQSSTQGDVWNLARISGGSPAVLIRQPTPQVDAVQREIDQLVCLEETARMSSVLTDIEQLARNSPLPRQEITLITDLQSANWQPQDAAALTELHQSLRPLAERNVHVVRVGDDEPANAAVTKIEVVDSLPLAGQRMGLRIGLKRFGNGAASTPVELRIDDRLQETRTVNLVAGAETTLDWSPTLTPGEHRLEVRLPNDSLQADNRRGAVLTVRDRVPVLLVNGRPSGQPWENATDLLRLALAPDDNSPFEPTVIPESELLSTPLAPFACVFLCDLALITDREARWLSDYLTQGGAVVICVGGQVRIDQYNQALLADDRRILPARLLELAGDPQATSTAFEFDPGDFSHPIVKPFQGNPNSGLELTRTFAYLKTEIPLDRGTRVALRFSNGDPAILTADYGAGRVILLTTSVDREWGTWAVWGHSFIPLMHELVKFAIVDRQPGRQLLVGEPLTALIDSEAVRTAVVTMPDQETASLEVLQRQATFDQTTRSGFFELRWGPPASKSVWYAVNVDSIESDLAAFDEKSFRQEFPETANWKFHTDINSLPQSSAGMTATASALPAQPWSRWLLLIAFWLLLVEQGLAWRFSAGMALLGLGVGLVLVQVLSGVSPWLAGLVFAAGLAAGVVLLRQPRGFGFR